MKFFENGLKFLMNSSINSFTTITTVSETVDHLKICCVICSISEMLRCEYKTQNKISHGQLLHVYSLGYLD